MIRRPPRSTRVRSSAASDVYKRQVILAKTIKGWTLGPDVAGKNATHSIKNLTTDQLRGLRDLLSLNAEIPDEALELDHPPYYRPPVDSPEYRYLSERRTALNGPLPSRTLDLS